jgi:hypothetical protein
MEMIAECWGVFCYTYAGVGATAALVITTAAQEVRISRSTLSPRLIS